MTCDGPATRGSDGSTSSGDGDVDVIHAGEGFYMYGSDVRRMRQLNVRHLCSDDEFFQLEDAGAGQAEAEELDEERETRAKMSPMRYTSWKMYVIEEWSKHARTEIPEVPDPRASVDAPMTTLIYVVAERLKVLPSIICLLLIGEEGIEREQLLKLARLRPTDDKLESDVVVPQSSIDGRSSVNMHYPLTAKPPRTKAPAPFGPQTPLPREDKFLLWSIWDDPKRVRDVYFDFMGKVARGEKTCTLILHADGISWGNYRYKTRAKDWAVGKVFDIDEDFRCTLAHTEDQVLSAFQRRDKVWTNRAKEMLESVGGSWDDEEIIYFLEWGMRFSADPEWCLLLSPPLKSGKDNMEVLRTKIDGQVDKKRGESAEHVTGMPAWYHSSGWAVAKSTGKGRATLNCRDHEVAGEVGRSGRPFGLNESTPAKDGINWVKAAHHRQACGVLFLLSREAGDAHPECRTHLQVTSASEDCEAFFLQFRMCLKHMRMQGTVLPTGALKSGGQRVALSENTKGLVKIYDSPSMNFGGTESPELSQRVAFIQAFAVLDGMWSWEMIVHKLAEQAESGILGPASVSTWASAGDLAEAARLLAPRFVRDWVARRYEQLGDRFQALPSWVAQYIDDSNGHHLGRARALKHLLLVWRLSDKFNLPVAEGKTQYGEFITLLGVGNFGPEGIMAVTERRRFVLVLWKGRIQGLTRWERAEATSIVGTLAFCVITAIKAKKLLRPVYRYLHVKRLWKQREGALWGNIPKYVRQAIELVIDAIIKSNGSPVLDPQQYDYPLPGVPQYYTDANRKQKNGYSGIAGVLMIEGQMYWYNLELSQQMVDLVPVHVTELLAEILCLFIFGPLLRNRFVQGWIDNQASLWAILSENSSDPRFQILLIMRADILEFYNIEVASAYVKSKDNTMADPASRNDLTRFYREAEILGFKEPKRFDPITNGPTDLADLFQALINATLSMKSSTRSCDFVP